MKKGVVDVRVAAANSMAKFHEEHAKIREWFEKSWWKKDDNIKLPCIQAMAAIAAFAMRWINVRIAKIEAGGIPAKEWQDKGFEVRKIAGEEFVFLPVAKLADDMFSHLKNTPTLLEFFKIAIAQYDTSEAEMTRLGVEKPWVRPDPSSDLFNEDWVANLQAVESGAQGSLLATLKEAFTGEGVVEKYKFFHDVLMDAWHESFEQETYDGKPLTVISVGFFMVKEDFGWEDPACYFSTSSHASMERSFSSQNEKWKDLTTAELQRANSDRSDFQEYFRRMSEIIKGLYEPLKNILT